MENQEKELGRFGLNIILLQDHRGKLSSLFGTSSINFTPDILIAQLRMFIRMLEDNYYPEFKGNITHINAESDE